MDRSYRPVLYRALAIAFGLAVMLHGAASADVNDYELETWRLINQERQARGLPALGSDTRLFAASEAHTEWMCANRTLSHYGSGGSTPGTRATAAGYPWFAIGETLAQGYTTPSSVVLNGWRRSSGHWNILMSSRYRDIGVGYVLCSGSRLHYWTVMVGNSSSPAIPIGDDGGGTAPTSTPPPTATPRPTSTRLPTTAPSPTPIRTATSRPTDPPPSATPTATRPPSGAGGAVEGTVTLQGLYRGAWGGTAIYVDGAWLATTDADGNFRTPALGAGTYRLEARRAGALTAVRSISVAGGTVSAGTTTLLLGDIVRDARIDYVDFSAMLASWYRCAGQSGFDSRADLDGDLCVNYTDYYLLRPSYGRSGPTPW